MTQPMLCLASFFHKARHSQILSRNVVLYNEDQMNMPLSRYAIHRCLFLRRLAWRRGLKIAFSVQTEERLRRGAAMELRSLPRFMFCSGCCEICTLERQRAAGSG